jgi:hypothetical protein
MVDARLLVVQTLEGGRGSTVEIVHESLIQGWPTLRRWLDENQDDAQLVDQLRVAARQWQQKGFDAGLLWRGDSADEARRFRLRYKGPLSDVERGFLDAVISHETAQARRRRAAIIGGFAALSLIVVATMVLLVIIQKSRTEAKDNLATAEVAKAEAEHQLGIAQTKERQRLAAEAEKVKAVAATGVVQGKLGESEEQLRIANEELVKALAEETESKNKAVHAQLRAEQNEQRAQKAEADALEAEAVAVKAKDEAKRAYDKEHDRAERLTKQLGSTTIDTLKP